MLRNALDGCEIVSAKVSAILARGKGKQSFDDSRVAHVTLLHSTNEMFAQQSPSRAFFPQLRNASFISR